MIENFAAVRPYVKAVFSLAVEQNKLKEWGNILEILSLIAKDEQIINLLKNPKIDHKTQKEFIESISSYLLQKAHLSPSPVISQLLEVLLRTRKITLLPIILELYKKSSAKFEQIFPAKVVSALPLSSMLQQKIKVFLEKKFDFGVTPEFSVDPQLIGGVVISINDYVIDGSIRGQLKRMRHYLSE